MCESMDERCFDFSISPNRFPKSPKEQEKWIIAMKRINLKKKDMYWQPHKYDVLCSSHFLKTCFDLTGKRVRLREGAVPSLFDFKPNSKKNQSKRSTSVLKSSTNKSSTNENSNVDAGPIESSSSELTTPTTTEKQPLPDISLSANLDHSYFFTKTLNLKRKQSAIVETHSDLKINKRPKRMSSNQCWRKQTKKSQKVSTKEDNDKFSLKSFLVNAHESGILKRCSQELLESFASIPLDSFKAKEGSYTSEQLELALTLYLFIPKAYAQLQQMQMALPCPQTLQSWLCHTDGSPGFLEQMFSLLQEKVKGQNGPNFKMCTILMEYRPLRKDLHWDDATGKLNGYVDYGFKLNSSLGDNQAIASQALVVMAVGVAGNWKLPLGYFFLDGQPLDFLGEIVKNVLLLLDQIGVSAIALVLDGYTADHKLFELLGGCVTPGQFRCTFPHPSGSGEEVFAFFDVHHLLLLAQNTLALNKELCIPDHGTATWDHIVRLKKMLNDPSPCSVTKLSTKQLFQRQKVKLQLSTQPVTASVANTLQVLRNAKTLGFLESEGTEVLIKLFDLLYQIFSSKNLYARGYQAAMTLQQVNFIQEFLIFSEKTLKSLTNRAGKKIIETKNNMFIIGFLFNIQSLRQMCDRFLVTGKMEHFLLFKFQHSPLKSFLSCFQYYSKYRGTFLTAHQFHANFKDILATGMPNMTSFMDMFATEDANIMNIGYDMDDRHTNIINFVEELSFTDFRSDRFHHRILSKLSSLVDNPIKIWTKRMILRLSKSLKCLDCLKTCMEKCRVVHGHFEMNNTALQVEGNWGLIGPSSDFVMILRTVIKSWNAILTNSNESCSGDNGRRLKRKRLEINVLEKIPASFFAVNVDHMRETTFGIDNHLFSLIRLICKEYLAMCGR